jgi:hypothetical protein
MSDESQTTEKLESEVEVLQGVLKEKEEVLALVKDAHRKILAKHTLMVREIQCALNRKMSAALSELNHHVKMAESACANHHYSTVTNAMCNAKAEMDVVNNLLEAQETIQNLLVANGL